MPSVLWVGQQTKTFKDNWRMYEQAMKSGEIENFLMETPEKMAEVVIY
ncbi:hypothetical protein ACQCWA_04650 [Rossellomorea aquimaris]